MNGPQPHTAIWIQILEVNVGISVEDDVGVFHQGNKVHADVLFFKFEGLGLKISQSKGCL